MLCPAHKCFLCGRMKYKKITENIRGDVNARCVDWYLAAQFNKKNVLRMKNGKAKRESGIFRYELEEIWRIAEQQR